MNDLATGVAILVLLVVIWTGVFDGFGLTAGLGILMLLVAPLVILGIGLWRERRALPPPGRTRDRE